jgi:hypothetical protein
MCIETLDQYRRESHIREISVHHEKMMGVVAKYRTITRKLFFVKMALPLMIPLYRNLTYLHKGMTLRVLC